MSRPWDVVVVGGGTAGVAAAAAAGRVGARVLLLEAGPRLGGTAVHAVLTVACGVFQQAEQPQWLSAGLSRRVGQAVQADAGPPIRIGPVWVQPFRAESWGRVLQGLLDDQGVVVRCGAPLCAALAATLRPGAWVDCSGDGVTAELLGARTVQVPAAQRQVPAVSGLVGPVGSGPLLGARAHLVLERAVAAGALPPSLAGLRVHRAGERALLKLNQAPPVGWDPLDPGHRDALLRAGLADLDAALSVLQDQVSALSGARWVQRATRLGVRESRQLVGCAQLSGAAVLAGAQDPEGVARGAWPVERWPAPADQQVQRITGSHYDVPLGALRSADREDLFCAGRCLSADPVAQGSIRVLGGCLETGQAAGTAAALQALEGSVSAPAVQPWRAWPEA